MLRCDPTHLGICPKTNLLDWHAFTPKSDYWDWFLTKLTKREGYTTLFAQTETSRVYKSNNEVLFTSNSQYNTSLGDTKYTAPVFLILLGMCGYELNITYIIKNASIQYILLQWHNGQIYLRIAYNKSQ